MPRAPHLKPSAAPRYGAPARPLARRLSSRQAILAMTEAPELRQLDAIEAPFDPLAVLAWTHQERPHTRLLAWLLDPKEPLPGGGHGLGASVLHRLVERAVRAIETLPGLEPDALPRSLARIDPAGVAVIRELPLGDGVRTTARAPDIRCTWRDASGATWLVLIENKIDAGEGDGQVRDYLAWAARHHPDARRLLLYVTPDGRSPDSAPLGEVVVPLTWSDVADAGLDALAQADARVNPAVRAFVTSVLDALRMRFGGRADLRALVESLHDAHPRAAALAASPATEPSLLEPLQKQFPRAAWHLRTLRPRAHRWTRAWAERVAAAFRELAPEAPALVPCAPHAERPDMASWSIEGVTQALSLYAFCTAGVQFGSHRPRAWAAMRAPNLTARAALEARDQLAAVEAMPPETRAWLLGASPVNETPASWRWLCAGGAVLLSRGYSLDDEARRAARALHEALGAHLGALAEFARAPAQRLYSCDLDADHLLPTDARDRAALAAAALPEATRVLVLTRQPTAHPYELRREHDLGVALGAAFGGTGALAYDYAPSGGAGLVDRPSVVLAGAGLFRAPDDGSLREAMAALHDALAAGAWLLLCGDRWDHALARRHLGDLVAPIQGGAWVEEFPSGGAEVLVDEAAPAAERFAPFAARDGRLLTGALCARVSTAVAAPVRLRVRGGELVPLVAGWRAGAARVVLCAGGLYGPWGRALQQRPESFARWFEALVAFAAAL